MAARDGQHGLPEALPEEPPGRLGEDPVGQLEAAPGRAVQADVERVLPVLEAGVDVRDVRGQEPRAEREGDQPDDDEGEAAGGHVEDRQQRSVEHQRRADVAQQHERRHRQPPDDEHRPEVLERRQGDPQDPPRAHDHHLAGVAQVAGEEDDEADLGELRRLEEDPARQADAQVGAVDLIADARQPREDEQHQRHGHDRVAVALELAVVAKEDDRRREQDEPEHEPLRLLARLGGVDPVDHDDPEARQQGDEREHVGIGVGQGEADEDVGRQAQRRGRSRRRSARRWRGRSRAG